MKKQIIIGVIILIALILLPFAINFLIQMPAKFDVVSEPENWLMFWPTYISAAASFFMIYVTYLSLKQNRKQLDEMKRQWDAEHKPGKGHGLFTYFLLKKLQETSGDVTYDELAGYINKNVKKEAFLINEKPQTPVVATSPKAASSWKSMKLK